MRIDDLAPDISIETVLLERLEFSVRGALKRHAIEIHSDSCGRRAAAGSDQHSER